SFYVLDNIIPLEELNPKVKAATLYLFPIAPAVEYNPVYRDWFGGQRTYAAPNPGTGAELVYWVKDLLDASASFAITDAAGKEVALRRGLFSPLLAKERGRG